MPKHEFVVESRQDADNLSLSSFSWNSKGELGRDGLSEEDHVSLEDEFISYINDSLNWLPTWNPSTKTEGMGLNHYGVTVISGQNLRVFRGILQAWTDLLGFAPENIGLKGSYFTIVGVENSGQYEKLEYKKTILIKHLQKLIRMIDRAVEEDKCILHLGI
ncbi:hypothetical protein LBW89_20650 [Paenibacillus sp. alder61]|uniref:hypothetical protein n=1 Tax=Paenibacillus sp. alder61 TaxID=2862948 RepID=UPI001CD7B6B9|nr:hypothetical protein [Paenibacillus sp. alder61]MCA1295421.1 hypothetical protein [Paenibacillus sp. alder61]